MSERTKLALMLAALAWALVVSVVLGWALKVSINNDHYGFGLGFAIILAGLVVAVALVCRDAATSGDADAEAADHQRQKASPPAEPVAGPTSATASEPRKQTAERPPVQGDQQ